MYWCQLAAATPSDNRCDRPQNLSATVLSLSQVVNPSEGRRESILRRHELIPQLFSNLIQYPEQSLTQTHKQAMKVSQLVFKQVVGKETLFLPLWLQIIDWLSLVKSWPLALAGDTSIFSCFSIYSLTQHAFVRLSHRHVALSKPMQTSGRTLGYCRNPCIIPVMHYSSPDCFILMWWRSSIWLL